MLHIEVEMPDGSVEKVAAEAGLSIMEVLRGADILDGECNGSLACATCHVWVKDVRLETMPAPCDGEEDMLDVAFHLAPSSRLSCQIIVSEETDGLRIALPRPTLPA